MVGGLEAGVWERMYKHTHTRTERIEWPNGGCYMGQEQLLIDVWELLTSEIRGASK